MPSSSRLLLPLAVAAIAAGCASTAPFVPGENTVPGKFLVYRDTNGNVLRQFDYPSEDICRRVEAVAGRSARCQPESIGHTMQAKAMLRYNPPGIMVPGHYLDVSRCQTDTRSMGPGVELVESCAVK